MTGAWQWLAVMGAAALLAAPMAIAQGLDDELAALELKSTGRYADALAKAAAALRTVLEGPEVAPERAARWADPAGGYIHAMHAALWGDMHWRILGKKSYGSLDYEGGWQNNRPSPMHLEFRFVENLREELDAPGEWFHDARTGVL